MTFSVEPVAFHDITHSETGVQEDLNDTPFPTMKRDGDLFSSPLKQPRLEQIDFLNTFPWESDEKDIVVSGSLMGGTTRSRRMVTNNMTVQSAYMCLLVLNTSLICSYIRRDVFEQEKEEPLVITDCLQQKDLDSILKNNEELEASIQEEFQTLIQLRSDLSKRLGVLTTYPMESRNLDTDVFLPGNEYRRWIRGTELIREVVKEFDAKPGVVTHPKNVTPLTPDEEAMQNQLNRTDSEYRESEQVESPQIESDSLVDGIVQLLRGSLEEISTPSPDSDENEGSTNVNVCTHGKLDPICIIP